MSDRRFVNMEDSFTEAMKKKRSINLNVIGAVLALVLLMFPVREMLLTYLGTAVLGLITLRNFRRCRKKLTSPEKGLLAAMGIILGFVLYYKIFDFSEIAWSSVIYEYFTYMLIGAFGITVRHCYGRRFIKVFLYSTLGIVLMYCAYIAAFSTGTEQDKYLAATQFTTMLMMIVGIMTMWFFSSRNRYIRLLTALGIIVCFSVNLFVLQKGLTLVFSLILMIILAVIHIRNRKIRNLTVMAGIAAVLLLSFVSFQMIDSSITSIFKSKRLAKRAAATAKAMYYGDSSQGYGSFARRLMALNVSLTTMTDSPTNFMFGVGEHPDDRIVGNHSEILDFGAKYGIFGISALIFLLVMQYRFIVQNEQNIFIRRQTAIIYSVCILRVFIGSLFVAFTSAALLLLLPLVLGEIDYEVQHPAAPKRMYRR